MRSRARFARLNFRFSANLHARLGLPAGAAGTPLAIAVNADSLATWVLPGPAPLAETHGARFELVVEDQDHTGALLRAGRVIGAITTEAVPIQGCRALRLGVMRYAAVCSHALQPRDFALGPDADALASAPMLVFNRKDALQARFARRYTRRSVTPPIHGLPDSHAFVEAARLGLGWGMVPEAVARPYLDAGLVCEIDPGARIEVPLHWQYFRLDTAVLDALTRVLQLVAQTMR